MPVVVLVSDNDVRVVEETRSSTRVRTGKMTLFVSYDISLRMQVGMVDGKGLITPGKFKAGGNNIYVSKEIRQSLNLFASWVF